MQEASRNVVYFDNAATSWPKPPAVADTMRDHVLHLAANPGRAGHRMSAGAARVLFDTRETLAQLLGIGDSRQIVFTHNATEGLNCVIHGLLRPGDHVVTTGMEHNSVMRPLRHQVDTNGVSVTIVPADSRGRTSPAEIAAAVTSHTRLVVVNHASNVVGTLAPLAEIKQAIGHVPLLVDAAQTAGAVPIDVERDGIDLLACTGHKSLLGPPGTGLLYIHADLVDAIQPLLQGGTGSNSESDTQPTRMPDRFESGTRNGTGIAGLGAAVQYLHQRGVSEIRRHEIELTTRLLDGLAGVEGVNEYGPVDAEQRTATLSINIAGRSASEVGFLLDRQYDIAVRVGLHCAPQAHRTIGTFPDGTVRLSPGALTTTDEVEAAIAAIREIAAGAGA